MPFYTYEDVLRVSQIIQEMPCEVSDELRGWMWREPPLLYGHSVLVNASDIGFDCGTGRLAFLRHVLRMREEVSKELSFGSFVHWVIGLTTYRVKTLLYQHQPKSGSQLYEEMEKSLPQYMPQGLQPFYQNVFKILWRKGALTYSSSLDKALDLSKYLGWDGLVNRVVPWICEFPLDGRLIGLSRAIRVDALIPPSLIIEFKTRPPRRSFEIALAGYSLAFESMYRVPVNHAVLLYLEFNGGGESVKVYERIVKIDDGLRMEFVERRDLYAGRAAASVDPGLPPSCDTYCPYLGVCRNGS